MKHLMVVTASFDVMKYTFPSITSREKRAGGR